MCGPDCDLCGSKLGASFLMAQWELRRVVGFARAGFDGGAPVGAPAHGVGASAIPTASHWSSPNRKQKLPGRSDAVAGYHGGGAWSAAQAASAAQPHRAQP